MEINQAIHYAMQDAGQMTYREHEMKVLVARQEITGADRQWAAQYEPGNVIRYAKGSKTLGIEAGEYARVESVDEKQNMVTVDWKDVERDPWLGQACVRAWSVSLCGVPPRLLVVVFPGSHRYYTSYISKRRCTKVNPEKTLIAHLRNRVVLVLWTCVLIISPA